MGYSSGHTCFPTRSDAVADWCARLESGAYATSCTSCTGTTCTLNYLKSNGAYGTVSAPVSTPACTVPDPVGDAVTFSGAVIALWVAIAAAMFVVRFFARPHVDAI